MIGSGMNRRTHVRPGLANLMVSSARVCKVTTDARVFSSQEEDLLLRIMKKVKEPGKMSNPGSLSYKESLLQPLGGMNNETSNHAIVHDELMTDPNPQVREYGLKANAKGPVIPLSDEELKMWSAPWRNTLVVNVLGKKVNFPILENKLHHSWTKNRSIQIIDMHDGYYQVTFKSEEDY